MALTFEHPVIDLRSTQPTPTDSPITPSPAAMAAGLVQAIRPYQWAKNGAVLLVPGLVILSLGVGGIIAALGAVVAFCLAASSVYLLNDVVDRERDLEHPGKRNRAIAAGLVSPELALGTAGTAALVAVAVGTTIAPALSIVVASYLALTAAYSLGLKHVPYVDVGVLAAGFVLRVLAGAVAIGAVASPLLLTGVFAGAVFIALGKRRSELVLLGDQASAHRAALGTYTIDTIDTGLCIAENVTVIAFAAWILLAIAGPIGVLAAVAGGVSLHGVLDAYRRVMLDGGGGDPTRDLLTSPLVLSSLATTGVIAATTGMFA
ncbi:MAG: UbiA family prenyltransferase [Acidimicrobiales bacterium]|nr:UbiA family prenyltransferase [Acidimicrobiales bacterium]